MASAELKRKRIQQIVLPTVILILGHVIATQRFAQRFRYDQRVLGPPAVYDEQADLSWYYPWKFYEWGSRYWANYQDLVIELGLSIPVSVALAVAVVAYLAFKRSTKLDESAHGAAKWEDASGLKRREIAKTPQERLEEIKVHNKKAKKDKNARLRKRNEIAGVVLGKDEHTKRYLRDYRDSHTLIVAPTGAGKGVGLVIPTLLDWQGSAFVIDIKGENYEKTVAWRKLQGNVIYFNPLSPESARFNPLLELSEDDLISDLQKTSIDLTSASTSKEIFKVGSQNVLQAVIGHVMLTEPVNKTLGRCSQLLSEGLQFFKRIEQNDYSHPHMNPFLQTKIKGVLAASEELAQSWISSAQVALALWDNPRINEITSESDFTWRQFQFETSRPTTLYFAIPPQEVERMSPLIRLMLNQLLSVTTKDNTEPHRNHRILMMLDEFPRLGKLAQIKDALTYTRSYGMKFCMITQSVQRLNELYGKDQDFMSSCHVRVFTATNDDYNAQVLSKMLGDTTATKEQVSQQKSSSPFGSSGKKNVSTVQYARKLMTIEEAMNLNQDDAIILEAGQLPVRAKKVKYFEDEEFSKYWRDTTDILPRSCTVPEGMESFWSTHTPDAHLQIQAMVSSNAHKREQEYDAVSQDLERPDEHESHEDMALEPSHDEVEIEPSHEDIAHVDVHTYLDPVDERTSVVSVTSQDTAFDEPEQTHESHDDARSEAEHEDDMDVHEASYVDDLSEYDAEQELMWEQRERLFAQASEKTLFAQAAGFLEPDEFDEDTQMEQNAWQDVDPLEVYAGLASTSHKKVEVITHHTTTTSLEDHLPETAHPSTPQPFSEVSSEHTARPVFFEDEEAAIAPTEKISLDGSMSHKEHS